MSEADDLVGRLVAQARQTPPLQDDAADRIWDGLQVKLDGAVAPPPVSDAAPVAQAGKTAWVKLVASTTTSGALAGILAGAVVEHGGSPEPATMLELAQSRANQPEPNPEPEPKLEPKPKPEPEPKPEPKPIRPSRRAAPNRPSNTGRPTTDPAAEFAAEARLLQASYRAFKRGDHRKALRLLGEHARDFPRGQLVQERRAVEVEVLCAMGKREQARTKARAFAAAYPHSTHVTRIETACPMPEPEPEPNTSGLLDSGLWPR